MVLVLTVVIALVGGSALNLFSNESKQSQNQLVGFRLEALARNGLESNFSLLRSMGTVTAFKTGESVVISGASGSKNINLRVCSYFPRTDDAILPTAVSGDYADTNLLANPSNDDGCLKARANNAKYVPEQLARYSTTTSSDLNNTGSLLDVIQGSVSSDTNFRSVFPWVRHRSESVMNDQFGASEDIKSNLNACGLMSQLKISSTNSAIPLQRYPFEQRMDGFGETWIDMGSSTMNLYKHGLTLEAWVWMGNVANSQRVWQRVFDIGRSAQDGNIVLAYQGNSGKIQFHIKPIGKSKNNNGTWTENDDCAPRTSESPDSNCNRGELFAIDTNAMIDVPENSHTGNSLDESGGNDLWYYLAVRVDDASVNQPKVRIYTQCSRTGGGSITHADCSAGTLIRGEGATGLRKRGEWALDWTPSENHEYFRKSWVGKSHWQDDDFRGKMRDLRVWARTLTEDELARPITGTSAEDERESSITRVTNLRQSLRISPLQKFGDDRLLLFTVKESESWRLVSCAWNNKASVRKTRSLRFRVIGKERPEVTEFLPH